MGASARIARWWAVFGEKALGVGYATLLMAPAWLMIHGLSHFASRRTPASRVAIRLACGAIFIAGLVFALRFELGHATERLRMAMAKGHPAEPVDLLGPTLGVGLEGYAVFSSWLTGSIKALLVGLWASLAARMRRPSGGGGEE
jgi:hypothetical protein